jgi:hypothetical protein
MCQDKSYTSSLNSKREVQNWRSGDGIALSRNWMSRTNSSGVTTLLHSRWHVPFLSSLYIVDSSTTGYRSHPRVPNQVMPTPPPSVGIPTRITRFIPSASQQTVRCASDRVCSSKESYLTAKIAILARFTCFLDVPQTGSLACSVRPPSLLACHQSNQAQRLSRPYLPGLRRAKELRSGVCQRCWSLHAPAFAALILLLDRNLQPS